MKISNNLKDHLKIVDEAATAYLSATSAILFDEQRGKIHRAIRTTTDIAQFYRVKDFLRLFDILELNKINVEDKVYLVEQFELAIHGKETDPLEAPNVDSEKE